MADGSWVDLGYQAYSLNGTSNNAFVGPGALVLLSARLAKWTQSGVKISVVAEDRKLADWLDTQLSLFVKSGGNIPKLSDITINTLDRLKVSWYASRQPLLGSLKASQVVGTSILNRTNTAAVLPSFDVPIEELEFAQQEYLEIREELNRTGRMYARMRRLAPVLSELNSGIFRYQSEKESKAFIEKNLVDYKNKALVLYTEYGRALDDFGRSFEARESKQLRASILLTNNCEFALRQINTNQKKKQIISKKSTAWSAWLMGVGKLDLFEFEKPSNIDNIPIEQLLNILADYLRKSKKYTQNRRRRLRESAIGLSGKTLPERDLLADRLKDLEERRQRLISDINESGLFQLPVKEAAATSLRQYKSLENLMQQLDRGLALLDRYEMAYKWQRNWFALKPPTRRILRALMPLPVNNWQRLFKSWYLERAYQNRAENYDQIPNADDRLSAANALDEQRFFPYGFEPLQVGTIEENQAEETEYKVVFYRQLPEKLVPEQLYFALLPNGKSRCRYMALNGPNTPPGLAFFQLLQSGKLPEWTFASSNEVDASTGIKIDLASDSVQNFQTSAGGLLPNSSNDSQGKPVHLFLSKSHHSDHRLFLLYVLIASGRPLIIEHEWTEREITQNLLEDGFSLPFLSAALIRAIQAIEAEDHTAFEAIASECRRRLGIAEPTENQLLLALAQHLPKGSYSLNVPWRSTCLPLVVRSAISGLRTVVLPDGLLPGEATVVEECLRQSELSAAGFAIFDLPTYRAVEEWEIVIEEVVLLASEG
ncbi:MAG: hypothetical protein AAF741_01075 [Bacteroidota bacterium]